MKSFIVEEHTSHWFEAAIPVYQCQFNKEIYRDELFVQLGIHFPETLNNAVIKRRAEFLAGRYCAANLLEQLNFKNHVIGTGMHRNPLWPQGVKGSISHCDNYAVAVVTDNSHIRGVGVDIENRIEDDTVERVQAQILSAREMELVSTSNLKRSLAFSIAFSLKESFFKAAYPTVEKYFDFSAVTINAINSHDKKIHFSLNENLHDIFQKGMSFSGEFCLLREDKVATLVIV